MKQPLLSEEAMTEFANKLSQPPPAEGTPPKEEQVSEPVEETAESVVTETPTEPVEETKKLVEFPKSFKAKVYGQETEFNLFSEDGKVNPFIEESVRKHASFEQNMRLLAEERQQMQDAYGQLYSQHEALRAEIEKQKESELPDIADDDPYAPFLKGMTSKLKQVTDVMQKIEQQFILNEQQAKQSQQQELIRRAEEDLKTKFPILEPDDVRYVFQNWAQRYSSGEEVTPETIASAFVDRLERMKNAGITEFKAKTKVTTPISKPVGTPVASPVAAPRQSLRFGTGPGSTSEALAEILEKGSMG